MTKKRFSAVATFALATSLASTAHAEESPTEGFVAPIDVSVAPAVADAAVDPLEGDRTATATVDLGNNLSVSADVIAAATPTNVSVVTPQSIDPKYGDIGAFYGNIGAFYGDIGAFYGDIDAFWGDINPFYGNIDAFWGDISPFYGDIGAFWGDIDAFYGDIGAFDAATLNSIGEFWSTSSAQIETVENLFNSISYNGNGDIVRDGTPDRVMAALDVLIAQGEAQFGAAYQEKTGKAFSQLVEEIFARHGVQPYNKAQIERLSASQRAALYLDWHDSLMSYSGVDHVDHWMAAINWTPSITQIQGEGKQAIIGVIDGSFTADADLADNIAWSGGGTTTVNGHGAGVASLIAGAHDGEGVMGIAPEAKLATYNPFDENHTATWDDVADGIEALLYRYVGGNETGYVSVVNLSLGESGWTFSQGMADVLKLPQLSRYRHETTYVIAAGNDGISQTADIQWDYAKDSTFILVGSVDPNGEISSFSNRPGTACLVDQFGNCGAGQELYMRTVVAPGSLILVSDGQGGVVRHSGTSFAAPLVSGAISLLHDRWTWLVRHPEETAEIIFRSAQDLGAPGPDEVYGWGLLDVAASQSPLDFNSMTFTQYQREGNSWNSVKTPITSLLGAGVPSSWDTDGVYFTAFETVGKTYRDFAIPMSSLTYGSSTNVLGHGDQRFQDFISGRFANWLLSNGKDKDGDGKVGITQLASQTAPTQGEWTVRYDAIAPRLSDNGTYDPVHNAATLTAPGGEMSFTFGHGHGALALAGQRFGLISDHDSAVGGVNPILGLASGETFGSASYKPTPTTTVSVGFSEEREDWRDLVGVSEIERQIQRNLGAREASAFTIGVEQEVTDAVSVNVQWTNLNEDDAVLGAQTSLDDLLGNGSRTEAVTVSATVDLGDGLSFDLSATGAGTNTADGQLLSNTSRIASTAGQFTVNKRGLFADSDVLRVSVGQPLTIENGTLELNTEQVIDRETGELGRVTQFIGIETKRRYAGEFVYATPVSHSSELGLVGRYVSAGSQEQEAGFMVGANFGMRF
ncbi:MAG: S8 family serine peptidase [Pseudomonadota bacterium]